jgi:hypothetical protein
MVLFKLARDSSQVLALGRQIFPTKSKIFLEAYKTATERAYGYMFLDFRSTTDDRLRIRSSILYEEEDGYQRVFVVGEDKVDTFALVPTADLAQGSGGKAVKKFRRKKTARKRVKRAKREKKRRRLKR